MIKQQKCKKCHSFHNAGMKYGFGVCMFHDMDVDGKKKQAVCQAYKHDFIEKKKYK